MIATAVGARRPYWFEFHVSRRARERYGFDSGLFATDGHVVVADFAAARRLAHTMNTVRDAAHRPELAVPPAHINAMGLIDEIFHFVAESYRDEHNPALWSAASDWLTARLGQPALDSALLRFVEEFPPLAVHNNEITADDYLADGANREAALQELLILWLANANPALQPYSDLFDDSSLQARTAYFQIVAALHDFFETQPGYGPDGLNLIDMLRAPAIAVPHSITGQLQYIMERWGLLAAKFMRRLLLGLDFIREDEQAWFYARGPVTATAQAPDYLASFAYDELTEAERFSPDRDWMPRAVIMAKNTFVWLDQLSRKYQRAIERVDEIPDEELDTLAAEGFTGLWLIGVWERSHASRRIKQLCGNPDAHASAYSLHDYRIADDLGGEDAMHNLRLRAGARGIRMASDMVPNHMAIDSRWVVEHPDWFISLPQPPFPAYSFNGEDLSHDERVGIFLEDHYYSREDAAVVFKRTDRWSGDTRYVYHGNDGTSMPWNDTAQLDYLNPAVREAVIQTILHVARQFPIIRFDAAMTLAKKHYQRLWFPEPGSGAAIASRGEYGLGKAEFNAAMPEEFWREVVDRVAAEAPDTLLLAEAFWMMEGYFVRTLGMHRVYNSAFMNMLRDEENAQYRTVLKNTLEFDPEILKRFVNFVNNPDEKTAAEQFGKGDKYFGICTLMATLPGLPMFGHGQIEGFTEKYGMEYRRASWQETPDGDLVQRHWREIFPLLKRRYLFSEVQNFALYDFWNEAGQVEEDVYAYSNRSGGERGLVIFHNRYGETRGWVRTSVGVLNKGSGSLEQKTLGDALGLGGGRDRFTLFRDNVTQLEYIRRSSELRERGIFLELHAYECRVFLDFREVRDNAAGQYAEIERQLVGRGVASIEDARRDLELRPVREPFRALVNGDMLRRLVEAAHQRHQMTGAPHIEVLEAAEAQMRSLVAAINAFTGARNDAASIARRTGEGLWHAMQWLSPANEAAADVRQGLEARPVAQAALMGWLLVRHLDELTAPGDNDAAASELMAPVEGVAAAESATLSQKARARFDEWQWHRTLTDALQGAGLNELQAARAAAAVLFLTAHHAQLGWDDAAATAATLKLMLSSADGRTMLGLNRYEEVWWFDEAAWLDAKPLLLAVAALHSGDSAANAAQATLALAGLDAAVAASGYRVEVWQSLVQAPLSVSAKAKRGAAKSTGAAAPANGTSSAQPTTPAAKKRAPRRAKTE